MPKVAAGARFFRRRGLTAALLTMAMTFSASPAMAGPGYELDPLTPSIALDGEVPHGVAVDQASQNIYVTELTTNLFSGAPGQVTQLSASGTPTPNSPFVTGAEDFFIGVAVNPVTQGVYAYQTQLESPIGIMGVSRLSTFSSSGVLGGSFTPPMAVPAAPQLATDAAGRIYFPNNGADAVQVFDSTGALKETITCAGCPGGAFGNPESVALDSLGNLYVVDLSNGGRVVKFQISGGSYVYKSILQSGMGAGAVAVDPTSNDVLVGFLEDGYHIVAYTSAGTKFDDFGAELVSPSLFGNDAPAQIAVNGTTRKVYVTDPGGNQLWVFDRVASIPGPTAATTPADSLGQQEAVLQGNANPKGHSLSDCHFEYTDDADFDVNGYANAESVSCSSSPGGSASTPVLARVEGLTPNTTYDYRLFVTSSGGSAEGGDQSFTTLPPLAPSASTGSASAITQTTATISGSVNPHGGSVSDCHFEYVDETGFQDHGFTGAASKDCLPTPEGTTSNPVTAKIVGLAAATTYRFRIVSTNNSGTTEAASMSFATLADTCATKPALCPPSPPNETPPGTTPTPPPPVALPPASTPTPTKPLKCRKGFKKKRVHGKLKCVKIKKKHASRR